MIKANDSVPPGTFSQRRGGGTLRPLHEYSAGIGVLSAKAGLLTAKGADATGGDAAVVVAWADAVVVVAWAEVLGAEGFLPPQRRHTL